MRLALLLLFIVMPLAEIALLVVVGQHIGLLWTVLIVILTAVIGTTLLRMQGFGVMRRVIESVKAGKMPMESVIEGLCLLVAGAFLLTPGLITDTIGFLFLVPKVRISFARWALDRLIKTGAVKVATFGGGAAGQGEWEDEPRSPGGSGYSGYRERDGGPIIEGEFERVDEKTGKPKGKPRRDA